MCQTDYDPSDVVRTETVESSKPPGGVKGSPARAGKISLCTRKDAGNVRELHGYTEKVIKGVRYRVHSSYDSDADFKELYEKCLATRILKLHEQGCAGNAAGD